MTIRLLGSNKGLFGVAGTYNIEAFQGDTFTLPIVWRDENRDLVDLTGYTARMQVRVTVDADDFLLELTTENGGITLGGTAGTIDLTVSAEDMALIDAGSYKYDLEMVVGESVTKLLRGKFKVIAEVTR